MAGVVSVLGLSGHTSVSGEAYLACASAGDNAPSPEHYLKLVEHTLSRAYNFGHTPSLACSTNVRCLTGSGLTLPGAITGLQRNASYDQDARVSLLLTLRQPRFH